jgi:hypothetical protein
MTSIATLTKFDEAAKELLNNNLYGNSWRMTSYLIQLLNKLEDYYTSLNEQHPEDDFYTAQIATSSALEMINCTYKVPTSDERFEEVGKLYEATVEFFITEYSDDAISDIVLISSLANYVAEMRTYCWNKTIQDNGPSETKFKALKLAKRDEKAVQIAVSAAADAIFSD